MNSISLSELNDRIRKVVRMNFDQPFWIRAEISELNENYAGHCYLELIEKSETSDDIIAKARANCWASTYRMLKPYFEAETSERLRAGLQVLIAVTVEFHAVYGFSLNIRDIDPVFTVGELVVRRLQIIRQLEQDGVAEMNKQIELPSLVQRLAVISSATAAGYGDFSDQLKNNTSRYAFYPVLFPAVMQGDKSAASIITALDKIYGHLQEFDAVVIIRGGGSTTDLSCFDSYELAANCAQFPLPVIVGVGHQRDVSVLDMVAHTALKTPTAVAEFLIHRLSDAKEGLYGIFNEILACYQEKMHDEERYLETIKWRIKQHFETISLKKKHQTDQWQHRLIVAVDARIKQQQNRLEILGKSIEIHSPIYLLERGYSLTTLNGIRVNSIAQLKEGERVRTYVKDGAFDSEITALLDS